MDKGAGGGLLLFDFPNIIYKVQSAEYIPASRMQQLRARPG